ncbi:MAG: ASKHA domain-containing protein [Vicinamibacterales bacterium]
MPPTGRCERFPAGGRAIFVVRFLPEGRSVELDGPTDAFQAAAACGILLEQPCAGLSRCGRCRVRVVEGAAPVSAADRDALEPDEMRAGWRLACALTLRGGAVIEVPGSARSNSPKGFGAAAVPDASRVPLVAPGPEGGRAGLGLAVDIGTTSLAAALVDLRTGVAVAAGSVLNPQATFGADVMSRIHAAGRDGGTLRPLMLAVRRGLAGLVRGLMHEAGAPAADVVTAAVVGNPAMLHLWRGEDPWGLGVAPYEGRWTAAIHTAAGAVALPIAAAAPVYVFPCVRSHVGADAVAAAVAVGLDGRDSPTMILDLGTNSEIVLSDGRQVLAASTAAGPAFECGGISCGMSAADGAIDALRLEPDGRWSLHVIGDAKPRGLCGSGLLDAVAELLRAGVVEPGGSLRSAGLADAAPDGAGRPRRVVIVAAGGGSRAIALQATDIRQLQLAIGAVRAGIEVVCAEAGLAAADLDAVFVAGTFGQYVRKASMLRLGLLPPVPPERVKTVGNAAGAGAVLALLDRRVRRRAEELAGRTRYVELAGRSDYANALVRNLRFPDGTEDR